jgi:hypothetical protein
MDFTYETSWALAIEAKRRETTGKIESTSTEAVDCLSEGAALDTDTIKDFLLFVAYLGKGRGRIDDRITADSLNTIAEWLFAGFTRVTGTIIPDDVRKSTYKASSFPTTRCI